MKKQISPYRAKSILSSHKKKGETITLVGGCFDILHIGHIKFFKKAKNRNSLLVVLLENDEKVKKLKGKGRPIFSQFERAEVLATIKYVDYVVLLPLLTKNTEYDKLIIDLKPDIIAATENDPILNKKKIQAKKVGAKLKIIPFIKTFSSSKLASLLGID